MMPDRPARYRGLRAKPENLGVTPLEPGEGSVVARVRGAVEVVEWWRSLTPVERGQVLMQAKRCREDTARREREAKLRAARNLRKLAARGMSSRKFTREAERLEQEAGDAERP